MAKRMIIVLMLGMVLPTTVRAQGVRANAGNIRDPRVALVTPAAMAMKHVWQISAGYEVYYHGIANDDLDNGFVSLFLPVGSWGSIGLNAQYFMSDIYRQGFYSFSYGFPLFQDRMSLGVDVGLLNISYDRDNFHLVDPNDPVFLDNTSKSELDLGLSSLMNPFGCLYIGLAAQHLNRPNLSLIDDDVTAPVSIQTGVMVDYPPFTPLLNLEYNEDEEKAYLNAGIESWVLRERAMVRGIYGHDDAGFSLAYVIDSPGSILRFDYEFRYPLSDLSDISDGFHQFVLTYASPPGDFELIAQPAKETIDAGDKANFKIYVKPQGTWNKAVDLQVTQGYDHISSALVPPRIRSEEYSVLTLQTDPRCSPGTYCFEIVGLSACKKRSCSIKLEVVRNRLSGNIVASVDTLVIEEIRRIRSEYPLLPYIFFNENDFSLDPNRYHILNPEREPVKQFVFTPERYPTLPLQYQNTLNIIAKRLWDHPDLMVTVTGYNSGWGDEKGNEKLSWRRAETVRDYLVRNCGVHPEQVKVQAHNMPPDPSSIRDPRSREENQRVEITCSNRSEEILDPIVIESTEIVSSDSVCTFYITDIVADAGVKKWAVSVIELPTDTFRVFRGQGVPDDRLVWNWKDRAGRFVDVEKQYGYRLTLWDHTGQVFETVMKKIYVRKVSRVRRPFVESGVEKTILILFAFDSADLNMHPDALRAEMRRIAGKMKKIPHAKLLIEGHTDVIGDAPYNHRLSIRRANEVARHLHLWEIPHSRIDTEGYGATRPLMTNALPEGRMINRRVEIYIKY